MTNDCVAVPDWAAFLWQCNLISLDLVTFMSHFHRSGLNPGTLTDRPAHKSWLLIYCDEKTNRLYHWKQSCMRVVKLSSVISALKCVFLQKQPYNRKCFIYGLILVVLTFKETEINMAPDIVGLEAEITQL